MKMTIRGPLQRSEGVDNFREQASNCDGVIVKTP
jgi:hypothetical protein